MAQNIAQTLALVVETKDEQALEGLKEFNQAVNESTQAMGEAAAAAKDASQASESFTKTKPQEAAAIDSLYTTLMKVAGAYTSVAIVTRKGVGIFRELLQEGEANILANAKLEAILHATGKAAEYSVSQVARWASELHKTTGMAETNIVEIAGSLAVFGNINAQIMPKVLEHSANLSMLWGDSLTGAAKKLGKALEDPIQGMLLLRDSEVNLDIETRKLIETLTAQGKVAEAQDLLLQSLDTRVGGLAASMHGATGSMGALKTSFNELKGAIGEDLLGIPGVEAALRALDGYLDKRKSRKSIAELFEANRTGGIEDLIAGMDSEELELQISLVADSKKSDVAQTFQRNFDATQNTILEKLKAQLPIQKDLENTQRGLAREAAEEAKAAEQLSALQNKELAQTQALADLYKATDTGRVAALNEEIELLETQRTADLAILNARSNTMKNASEEEKARLEAARAREGYYEEVLKAKRAELEDLQRVEIEEGYLSKLMGGISASDFVMAIPISFDFGRSEQEELEEQLSSLKSQINKLWTAGPAADDQGEWEAALDTLSDSYSKIEGKIQTIKELEESQALVRELLNGLISEEQKALATKLEFQQKLQDLEEQGLITAEQRQALWDKEYGAIDDTRSMAVLAKDEFISMGQALADQLLSAEALGSTLSATFTDFGKALASGEGGLQALSESSSQFVQSVMAQISQMAIASGLRVIAETGWAGVPVALGLFALGGVSGIAGGLIGGSGKGLDQSLTKSMQEEVKAREKLAQSINKTIDTEYDLLRRQLERNLIGIEEFRAGAGVLQSERNFIDAKTALSSSASSKISSIDSELSSMSGWTKFWTSKDEDLERQAKKIQQLFNAIDSVSNADELRDIQRKLKDLGVSVGDIPAYASGGEFMTKGPQLIAVGDNPGGVEHVKITPISSASSTPTHSGVVININGPVFDYEDLSRKLSAAGAKINRRRSI